MEKYLQLKKRNHYVWEKYLKHWAKNGTVFWVSSKGKISCDSPKGMCREEGFYKINTFNENDINYIRIWISKLPNHLKNIHEKKLSEFIEISDAINLCKNKKSIIKMADVLQYNSLENLYCGIENGAKNAIEGLANGNISILNDAKNLIGLYSYLGHQITRTKALKERFFQSIKEKNSLLNFDYNVLSMINEKNWWFLSYMFGYNIGFSLYESRSLHNIILVENISESTFITGDSPVINIHPDNDLVPKGEPTNSLDIYFPLSPKYALIISTSSKWGYLSNGAKSDDVIDLNLRVAKNSRYSIYGLTEDIIKINKNKIGYL